MRDVLVEHADPNEVIAVSREPGVLGETVKVEVSAQEPRARVAARVVDSQPVVENGTVRHRLRLARIEADL